MDNPVVQCAAILAVCAGSAHADAYLGDLTRAAIRGEAERVEAILLWGGDPNDEGWLGLTPLAAAMRSCSSTPEVIYALLKAGADIEARSGVGATPLMLAWQTGRADLAEMLLALGADPRAKNLYGDSADDYRLFFAGELSVDEFETARYTSLGWAPRGAGHSLKCERLQKTAKGD